MHENDVVYLRTYANLLECQLEKVTADLARTQTELLRLKGEDVVPLQEQIAALSETLRLREQALFGKSSERRSQPDGRSETEAPGDAPASGQTEPPLQKAPRRGHGRRAHEQLRVIKETFELPEDQQTCGLCGDQRRPMANQFEVAEMITALSRDKSYAAEAEAVA